MRASEGFGPGTPTRHFFGWFLKLAKQEKVFDFCTQRGFMPHNLLTRAGGLGCNEFLFARGGLVKAGVRRARYKPAYHQRNLVGNFGGNPIN
jgi:hypothetical protein